MRYLDIILIFSCFCFISCQKMPTNYDNNNTDIIAFGDSLTYSQGASRTETYPYFLGEIVNKEIINLGISGNTSADGVNRLSELDDYKPYMVLVEFSANDMFRKVPTKITEDNLIKIVKEIQKELGVINSKLHSS